VNRSRLSSVSPRRGERDRSLGNVRAAADGPEADLAVVAAVLLTRFAARNNDASSSAKIVTS